MRSMIIDFHTHVIPPQIKERRGDYVERDACFALLYSQPGAELATAEEIISNMDECGIDTSVVLNLGWQTHELCMETNDYILESVAKYPKRLFGFCAVQPVAGEKTLREIERCVSNGARGLGELRPDVQGFDLANTKMMKPIVELAVEHGVILLLHASEPVGHEYSGKGKVTPDVIYPFIVNFPELKLVCAHWGGGLPFYALMPEVERSFANVFFDTAATPFLYKPQIFCQVADIVGSEKILFGSDYPLLSPRRIIDKVESTNLSKEDKSKILGGNARKLLSL